MNIHGNFFNKANLRNPKIVKLLSEVYTKTYNAKNILGSYKTVLRIFSTAENLAKMPLSTIKLLTGFSSFEKFLEVNN